MDGHIVAASVALDRFLLLSRILTRGDIRLRSGFRLEDQVQYNRSDVIRSHSLINIVRFVALAAGRRCARKPYWCCAWVFRHDVGKICRLLTIALCLQRGGSCHGSNRPQADVVRIRTDGYASSYTDRHSYHQCSVRRYDRLVCNVVVDASAEATRVQTPRV